MAFAARGAAGAYPLDRLIVDLRTINAVPGLADAYCHFLARSINMGNEFPQQPGEIDDIKRRKNEAVGGFKTSYGQYVAEGHVGDGLSIAGSVLSVTSIWFPPAALIAIPAAISSVGCTIAAMVHGHGLDRERNEIAGEEAAWLGNGPVGEFIKAGQHLNQFLNQHPIQSDIAVYIVTAAIQTDEDGIFRRGGNHEAKVEALKAVLAVNVAAVGDNFVFFNEFVRSFANQRTTCTVPDTFTAARVMKTIGDVPLPLLVAAGVATRAFVLADVIAAFANFNGSIRPGLAGVPHGIILFIGGMAAAIVTTTVVVFSVLSIGVSIASIVDRCKKQEETFAVIAQWSSTWDDKLDTLQAMLENEFLGRTLTDADLHE